MKIRIKCTVTEVVFSPLVCYPRIFIFVFKSRTREFCSLWKNGMGGWFLRDGCYHLLVSRRQNNGLSFCESVIYIPKFFLHLLEHLSLFRQSVENSILR